METLILLVRNLMTLLLQSADKTLLYLSDKSKLLHLLRRLVLSLLFILLNVFRLIPFSLTSQEQKTADHEVVFADKSEVVTTLQSSAIGRALHQVLSLLSEIPVSSWKYDVVRSLAENLMHENLKEDSPALRDINCIALSTAFDRTMDRLEAVILDGRGTNWFGLRPGLGECGLGRAVRVVRDWYGGGGGGWANHYNEGQGGVSAEQMAAELLWLAEKLEGSGGVEVAVGKWAWASGLGWVALMAEARIQAYLVKVTGFLIKQAKDIGTKKESEGRATEQQKQTELKMLMTWLPLLCRANNGADAPTLSSSDRKEIERALEGIVDTLEEEENQEMVLSLWLHHFTHCPSSDWPNLCGSYIRWCTTSRNLLLKG